MKYLSLLFTLITVSATAQNAGHIKFKVTASGQNIFMDAYYKKGAGMRMEMKAEMKGESMNMVTLKLDSKPSTLYMLNERNKTYSETDVSADSKRSNSTDDKTYKVTMIGNETIAGYACKHVKVTTDKNDAFDLWTCGNLSGFDINDLMRDNPEIRQHNFTKALTDANAMGAVLKMSSQKRGEEFVMEAITIDKTEPAAGLFQIPSNYTKAALAMPGMENLTPEQQQMMREMIEKAKREAEQHK